jgi:PAS domain S-box-containing protein
VSAGKTAIARGTRAVSTIRARLFLMSAALLLPVAALLSYQGYRDFSDERRAAAAAAVRLAEITAAEVSRFVDDTRTALASLSRRPGARALDPLQCDPALSDYIDSHPYFTNVLTVDLSLRVVCSALAIPPRIARAPRDIWMDRLIGTGRFTLGKPFRGPITDRWVVVLAYPLRDQEGAIKGAVSLPVDLARFRFVANKAPLRPGTDIRIVTGDGATVASLENPDAEVGKNTRGRGIVDIVLADKQGEVHAAGADGVERIYGFLPIPETDWYVYAGIPASVALRNANERALWSAAIGSLIVLLALALAVFAARAVARPIEAAEETARKIAGGDRDARFRPEGASELAELLVQFNRTLDALAEDERRRRRSEGRLSQVVASVADGIITIDERQLIVMFNPGAERMFGRSAAEMIGQPLDRLIPERFRARHEEQIRGFAASGQAHRRMGEYRTVYGLRAGGEEFPIDAAVSQSGTSPDKLLTVILRDIAERMRTEQALRDYAGRLRLLSHRLFEIKENERRGLARELHDRVGADLTALSLNLKMLRGEMPADRLRQANARLDDCEAILDQTAQLVRDVLVDLRPPGLDELGLAAALTEHARQVAGRGGISVAVRGAEATPRLPLAMEITLFRIAQEALTNVARHAHATEVTLVLESGPDSVALTIADNGRGFDAGAPLKEPKASLGLVSMRERAESVGGRLRVESAPGKGTRVIVETPRADRGAA